MRRTRLIPTAAALAVLALLAGLTITRAAAQPVTAVLVISVNPVTPINGNATILLGTNDGVIGINCDGGSGPARVLGGPVVPAIVLDRLDADATRLRITSWGLNTPAVSGQQVFIACDFEVQVEALTAVRSLNRPAGRSLIRGGVVG
jgi:hypothetical protein